MTQAVGLLGYPLSHSISPAFQQAAFDYYKLPVHYHLWSAPPESLAEEVGKIRGAEYLGANVTVPHKERALPLLDGLDAWARDVGAVNTIVKEGGDLVGYNTDAYGFMRSLRERAGFDAKDKSVLILGAGGAARAAAFSLAKEGVGSLTIANRSLGRARSLADDVRSLVGRVRAVPLEASQISRASARADLIVNCTSIGMTHGEAEGRSPLEPDIIPIGALVYDVVYTPLETPLLRAARKAGARTLGGLAMLIFQGAASFELWTGRDAPIEVMYRAGEKALAALQPRADRAGRHGPSP